MDFDKALKIIVSQAGGRTIEVVVDAGSALIGSGGHCDIRLGPEDVAVEQLYFENQPGGLFAEVRANFPHVLVDRVPFQRGRVLDGRVFKIGKLEIQAQLVESQQKRRKSEERVRPGLLVLAALVLGLGVYAITARHGSTEGSDYQDAPPLFDATAVDCPYTSPGGAEDAVQTWLRDAAGRHERAPFSPQDGVEAVGLYRHAESCLKQLGRAQEAEQVSTGADSLATRLEKDFHVHRVRLSRALATGDTAAAQHEVSLLRGYLAKRGTVFAGWLDYLDRRLGLQGKDGK